MPLHLYVLRCFIGGIAETQEMLDFCGQHNITSDVEIIPIQKLNEGLRADAQERREVPLLHRYGFSKI
jgi:D-arabinose 1-dehydrogenase-like Zn-dependent alcohol dehydrogenase